MYVRVGFHVMEALWRFVREYVRVLWRLFVSSARVYEGLILRRFFSFIFSSMYGFHSRFGGFCFCPNAIVTASITAIYAGRIQSKGTMLAFSQRA